MAKKQLITCLAHVLSVFTGFSLLRRWWLVRCYISDLMKGMIALPNLIGLLSLSKVVKEETGRDFKSQE
jgi:Na+/alanine symporter